MAYIYTKGVTERFGFDGRRISQIQTVSQKQSNGDAPWDVYIQPASAIGAPIAMLGDIYIHRRGLWVLKNRLKSVVRDLEICSCKQLKMRQESAKIES